MSEEQVGERRDDVAGTEVAGGPTSEEKAWAMGCHLLALVTGFVGPLVFWLVKKESSAFIDEQGKEAVNFQLSMIIYILVAQVSMLVIIGILLVPAVIIFDLVCVILGAVKAYGGEHFRYPLCIRFIK